MFRSSSFIRLTINNVKYNITARRGMGGGGHHSHGPHVPEVHAKLGKFLLVSCYLWILYQMKENGAQLFGFYKPWEHEHHHDHHHYVEAGDEGDTMATLEEHDEEHEEEEEEESDE